MTGPAVEADDAGDDLEEEAAAAAEAPRQPRFDLDHGHQVRLVEALLFAAAEPLDAEADALPAAEGRRSGRDPGRPGGALTTAAA